MKKRSSVLVMAGLVAVAGAAWADTINGVEIDFVSIGNAGNAADTTSYGAVGYNYRIGRTEISHAQFSASGIPDAGSSANYWQGVLASGDAPVVNITWHQAAQYCNWLTSGNVNNGAYAISEGLVTGIDRAGALSSYSTIYVLPTEDEWYKAAYFTGSGYSLYANGTGTAPTHGVDANYNTLGGYFNGPAWTVGSGTAEQNLTYNMMGNVWEWLESADDGTLDNLGTEGMAFRGGDYFQGVGKLDSSARGSAELPSGEFYNTGMRVVEIIPEPGTISLMSLSTVSLFLTRTIRRRRRAGQTLVPVRRERVCDTFCTEEEFYAVHAAPEETDLVAEWVAASAERLGIAWNRLSVAYAQFDKAFWNRMVARHERVVARRKAFRLAFKKKAVDGFDAFLATILK